MRKFTYCTSILLCIFLLISIFPVYAEDVYSQSNEKERILIKYKDDSIDKVKQNIHRKYKNSNFNLKENLDDGIELWEVNKGSDVKTFINDLQNDPSVEFVQPDYKLAVYNESLSDEPFDPYFSYQWGLSNKGQTIGMPGIPGMDIDAVRAWKFTKGDPNVVVGVLDSGIDINHPDIKNNIYVNKGEIPENGIDDDSNGFIDDVNGWDFYNNDKTVYDSFDEDIHGTHVSGIIAATSDSQGICGVAPNVKILPLKFMSSPDGGYTSDAIRAINYAKFFGIKVINCSWTGSDYNKALKVVMKKSKILFVCAAGNSGLDVTNSPVYPACFDIQNVLSVGAIENQGNLAYFSNFGKDIDALAPGVNILSIIPNESYLLAGGTSAAAPFVTGIAALAQSLDNNLEGYRIAKIIKKRVIKNNAYPVKTQGRVNAYNVLEDIIQQQNKRSLAE